MTASESILTTVGVLAGVCVGYRLGRAVKPVQVSNFTTQVHNPKAEKKEEFLSRTNRAGRGL
jgi:membrane protein YqaA with SNARE-associated domain